MNDFCARSAKNTNIKGIDTPAIVYNTPNNGTWPDVNVRIESKYSGRPYSFIIIKFI